MIKPGEIQFHRDDLLRRTKLFSIRGPITGARQYFEVSVEAYSARVMPERVLELNEWVRQTTRILSYARDVAPLDGDLEPLSLDEKKAFGVRRKLGCLEYLSQTIFPLD